jgi:DNA-binding transcriptional LysR family regulator
MVARSISGAAQLLFVSQPAVSRMLSHTEDCLGFALFDRVKGRLYATPEAEKLFQQVQLVYAGLVRVNDAARDFSEHRGAMLRIVSHSTIGQMFLPEVIAAFHRTYPEVRLTFECVRQSVLLERLLQETTDLAITIFPVEHPSILSTPLCDASLICVMPAKHPLASQDKLSPAALKGHPLITYARSSPFGALIDSVFQELGELPPTTIEVSSPQNAVALALMGAGIALVDEFSAYQASLMGLVARRLAIAPLFHAVVAHRRFQPISQGGHAFIEVLRRLVGERKVLSRNS